MEWNTKLSRRETKKNTVKYFEREIRDIQEIIP